MKLFDWFFPDKTEETPESLRGIPDKKLRGMTNEQIICLALAVSMEAKGVWDAPLIAELYHRAEWRRVPNQDGSFTEMSHS